MEKKFKLGVIGAGFMATALIKGAIESSSVDKNLMCACDLSKDALDRISSLGVGVTSDSLYLCNNSQYVLFAIKPQNLNEVLVTIKNSTCRKFISIMAGVKKEKIKNTFPDALVARCMPNTPCAIGEGAVGLDATDYNEKCDVDFIVGLLSSLAKVVLIDEEKLGIVTGVSGSAPAYFYLFLKGVIDAGVKRGLTYEQAKTLATATMIGAGKMVELNSNKPLDELIGAVCSKGGTTIEAINFFNENNILDIVDGAVGACVKRSDELERL